MNNLQLNYAKAQAAYDTAFEAKNWQLVDQLEDPMLDAEFALLDWMFDVAVKTSSELSRDDLEKLLRKSNTEKRKELVDIAMRLNA